MQVLPNRLFQHGNVVRNFSYLATIQAIGMFVTLATYPFLFRVLGVELIGKIAFAQAIISYLTVLVSFGFNISGTREISRHRDQPETLNEIFSSIFILKGLLFLLSAGILAALILLIPAIREYAWLYILTLFTCLYDFLFPTWFFQGIEKMGYSAVVTVVAKLFFFVLIFVFVRQPADYLLVPLFNGIGSVVAGTVSIWIALTRERIRISLQPWKRLWHYLTDSAAIFVSNIASQVYVNINKVIIGVLFSQTAVGYYDLAEKVVLVMKLPQSMLNQALFPKVSKDRNPEFVRRMLGWIVAGNLGLYAAVFFAAPVIVWLLGGARITESIDILRLLAITVPLNAISSYLGVQILFATGQQKKYSRIIVASVLLYAAITLGLYLTNFLTINTLIITTIGTELMVLIMVITNPGLKPGVRR